MLWIWRPRSGRSAGIFASANPSISGRLDVAEASSGERGGEFYFRETVEEVLGPPREGSAEAHSEECYFGGAVVGRVQAVQDFQRFGVSLVFSELIPCFRVFLAFGSFVGQ